jgi:scyllo-inositol 2-dehydrogenase (NADP+)
MEQMVNSQSSKLSVGIIGYGRIGVEHADWIRNCSNAQVGAIFDATPARAELARENGFRTAKTIDELLADQSIGAVLVATPTSMHYDHAVLAVDACKHVMIEKPVTLDAAHAVLLKERAEKCPVKLCVFQSRRWDIDYLTVKGAIRSGLFGSVFNVESRLGQWGSVVGPAALEFRPGWRNERAYGGGGLYDWGSHLIDQLWQLMLPAKPVQVFAQLRGNVWTKDCDDLARVLINFDNGAVALCEINTTTLRPLARWHVDGDLGSANSPYSLQYDTHEWARLDFIRAKDREAMRIPEASPGLGGTQIWEAFAKSIQDGSEPPVTIDSVIITMKLLDAARESSQSGTVVRLGG